MPNNQGAKKFIKGFEQPGADAWQEGLGRLKQKIDNIRKGVPIDDEGKPLPYGVAAPTRPMPENLNLDAAVPNRDENGQLVADAAPQLSQEERMAMVMDKLRNDQEMRAKEYVQRAAKQRMQPKPEVYSSVTPDEAQENEVSADDREAMKAALRKRLGQQ